MKQHITPDQLWELSEQKMIKLREGIKLRYGDLIYDKYFDKAENRDVFYTAAFMYEDADKMWVSHRSFPEIEKVFEVTGSGKKTAYLPLLSIGQMIEFIDCKAVDKKKAGNSWQHVLGEHYNKPFSYDPEDCFLPDADEFCDALWEVVKQIL